MILGVFPFASPYFRSHIITTQLDTLPPNTNTFLQFVVEKFHVLFFAKTDFGSPRPIRHPKRTDIHRVKVKVKVNQSRHRPGVAQRIPGI